MWMWAMVMLVTPGEGAESVCWCVRVCLFFPILGERGGGGGIRPSRALRCSCNGTKARPGRPRQWRLDNGGAGKPKAHAVLTLDGQVPVDGASGALPHGEHAGRAFQHGNGLLSRRRDLQGKVAARSKSRDSA